MASVALRQETLDQLYNVLRDPLKYGDRFLLQITKTPKDGLVSVNLLHNMAKVLNPYPIEYIQHCIPLDSQQRFKWNSEASRVGLKENARYYETDAYGFSIDLLEDDQNEPRTQVMPVLYDNGSFYIDNEHVRLKGQETTKCLFEYDRLDIDPLGSKRAKESHVQEKVCFNCGMPAHIVSDCPQPYDRHQIAKRRNEENVKQKRIHEWIETKLKVDAFKPGILSKTLQEALGITIPPGEPPYYAQMRCNGYPPGYLGFACQKEEIPLLKTYENEIDYQQAVIEECKDTLIELVEYPGLQFVNTSQLEQQTAVIDSQYWSYYYHYYYSSLETEYPPGTNQAIQTYPNQTVSNSEMGTHHTIELIVEDNQSVDMDISSDEE